MQADDIAKSRRETIKKRLKLLIWIKRFGWWALATFGAIGIVEIVREWPKPESGTKALWEQTVVVFCAGISLLGAVILIVSGCLQKLWRREIE